MAEVFLEDGDVRIALSAGERIGALRSDVVVRAAEVKTSFVADDPFEPIHGIRAPGTAWPRVIALGTWRSRRHGRTFAAAYRNRPALVLDLNHHRLARIVVSTSDAARLATALSSPNR
jgi:hypothetical protein